MNEFPLNFSGVVPALAQVADFGPPRSECGPGCLMPWLGKLYVLNYVSHRKGSGTGTGLRVIDENFQMTRHPAGVDGTYANRLVHHESVDHWAACCGHRAQRPHGAGVGGHSVVRHCAAPE